MQKWQNSLNLANEINKIHFLPEISERKYQNIYLTKWSNPSEAPAQNDQFQGLLPNQNQAQYNVTNIGLKMWKLTHIDRHTHNKIIHRTQMWKHKFIQHSSHNGICILFSRWVIPGLLLCPFGERDSTFL